MRVSLLLALLTAIAGGALAGLLTRPPPSTTPSRDTPRGEDAPRPAPVEASGEYVGVVLGGQTADLAPKYEGRVVSVTVKAGARVTRGVVIAEMDVSAGRQALLLAEAALLDAQQRLERRSGLAAGVLSQEEISNAKVLVLEKRARVEELRAAVAESYVRAPFDGVVAARYLDPGSIAGPTRPILRLLGSNVMRVRFAVPEDRAGTVTPGLHARLKLKSLDAPLAVVVESVSPEVDAAARMIFAIARVDAQKGLDRGMPAGMVGRVVIETATGERTTAAH